MGAHTAHSMATIANWRLNGIGILRILFGLVWAIDASFKWQPAFIQGLPDYLSGSLEGQPTWVQDWINFWIHTLNINPTFFAYLTAVAETAIAIGLILGVLSNLVYLAGLLLSVGVWTTAEGFGGPYVPGSVDIGAAIIYVFVFVALFLIRAGLYCGLDRRLTPALKRWGFLASGLLTIWEGERREP